VGVPYLDRRLGRVDQLLVFGRVGVGLVPRGSRSIAELVKFELNDTDEDNL
jgi:hypothetical protein